MNDFLQCGKIFHLLSVGPASQWWPVSVCRYAGPAPLVPCITSLLLRCCPASHLVQLVRPGIPLRGHVIKSWPLLSVKGPLLFQPTSDATWHCVSASGFNPIDLQLQIRWRIYVQHRQIYSCAATGKYCVFFFQMCLFRLQYFLHLVLKKSQFIHFEQKCCMNICFFSEKMMVLLTSCPLITHVT